MHDIDAKAAGFEKDSSEDSQWYSRYSRPGFAELLQAVRLDVSFDYAEKNTLVFSDASGKKRKVTDFVGGFGSTFFGHYHQKLKESAIEFYSNNFPIHTQGSVRKYTSRLAKKLNDTLSNRTKNDYVILFANSGTEAVEAAIKHSEFSLVQKLSSLLKKIQHNISKLKKHEKILQVESKSCMQSAEKIFALPEIKNVYHLIDCVQQHNMRVIARSPVFLACERSFHGKTTGSVSLTSYFPYREPFLRLGPRCQFLSDKDLEDSIILQRSFEENVITVYDLRLTNDTLELKPIRICNIPAVFIEPIQGEGGVHIFSEKCMQNIRNVTKIFSVPLICDEIQSGFGRAGFFLASEMYHIYGDYIILGKSLGGGISKISALAIESSFFCKDFSLIHSSTFAEDDFSSYIALEALSLFDREPVFDMAKKKGEYFYNLILHVQKKYPDIIKEIRGTGLFWAIEFYSGERSSSNTIRTFSGQNALSYIITGYLLHEHNIRVAPTLSCPNTLRIEPSVYIEPSDIEILVSAIESVCDILDKANAGELCKYLIQLETPGVHREIVSFKKDYLPYETPRFSKKAAFICHFIQAKDIRLYEPSFHFFSDAQCSELLRKISRILHPVLFQQVDIHSSMGENVSLSLLGIYADSALIEECIKKNDTKWIREKIEKAIQLAKSLGCHVVGFGGYTSIVTNNCLHVYDEEIGITSGNSFTVAMGIEAIINACRDKNVSLENSTMAVVGANGNISSTYGMMIASKVGKLILIGRSKGEHRLVQIASEIYFDLFKSAFYKNIETPLGQLAEKVYHSDTVKKLLKSITDLRKQENIGVTIYEGLKDEMQNEAPIQISTSIDDIKSCDIIVSASNSAAPIIFAEHIQERHVIICDIAVPPDTSNEVIKNCSNVYVIHGGIVELPVEKDLSLHGFPLEPGKVFACLSETVILALSGIHENFSYGRITKTQVKKISELGRLHGFSFARMKYELSF